MTELATRTLAAAADVIAPDGCEVRLLAATRARQHGAFHASAGRRSRAPWSIARSRSSGTSSAGSGRMWRRLGDRGGDHPGRPGVSLAIPTGTRFQLRNDGAEPLAAVAVTMPPWPGEDEARFVEGPWQPSVG